MVREDLARLREHKLISNFYFIALALLLAFGSLQFAGTALSTEKPVVSVVSCSMYPEYDVGDILFVQGQDFDDIEEGHVVVYDVRNKASFSVGGSSYNLEASENDSQPSVETSVGEVKLKGVESTFNNNNNDVYGLFEISGENYRLSTGDQVNIEGETVNIDSVSGIDIPIVHRVIEKNDGHLETKGDNNQEQLDFEKNVTASQIHGTVFFKVPILGNIKILAMDFTGLTGGQPFVLDTTPSCQVRT